jgi:hypothetical protein
MIFKAFNTKNVFDKSITATILKDGGLMRQYLQKFPFSMAFLEKNLKFLDHKILSRYQKLSEQFMIDHFDNLDWFALAKYQTLSGSFLKNYARLFLRKKKLLLLTLSHQKVPESLIESWRNCINYHNAWALVFESQDLSQQFREKYRHKLLGDASAAYTN